MSVIERQINVSYRHRVFFTRGVFVDANPLLREVLQDGDSTRRRKLLVTLDEDLAKARPALAGAVEAYAARHSDAIDLVCPPVLVEGGERAKTSFFHVSEIQSRIERHRICRHSYVLAVGGGAHLDVVGLAAATAHRGVRHIRVPTTTLAQDDSGVGVKNGINAFGKKNFIGTFAPPFAVVNDLDFLESLGERDKRAGYVEAVKVALIRDAGFFDWIEENAASLRAFKSEAMEVLIRWSAELHVNHIASSGDPFEFGSARPLDFGHWVAHKLEQVSGFRLRHGEAVAIGIAVDTIYARERGMMSPEAAARILKVLVALGFDLYASELAYCDTTGRLLVLAGLEEFREHLGGELTITLLEAIGRGVEVHSMDQALVERAIRELSALARPETSQT